MIITQYHHYTLHELIKLALSKPDPTPLEQELTKRLIAQAGAEKVYE